MDIGNVGAGSFPSSFEQQQHSKKRQQESSLGVSLFGTSVIHTYYSV
jgi:hypothetical protein